MVQRKADGKLGIHQAAEDVKNEKLLSENIVRSSSPLQHQAELTKKMKKSGSPSVKNQQLDHPNSTRRLLKPAGNLPNYMKSTTSSDARKEKLLQVSTAKNPQTISPPHVPRKATKKTSARTTSLKRMRALTKNLSFKHVRAAAVRKKCAPAAVFCEDLDAQRATCSSTLKDCKFPAYLALNHGGTESEGTSAVKVCPYTYCSLNGHHHAPMPPLKSFLSARRRALKAQRSIKLGCLSARAAKPTGDCPIDDVLLSVSARDVTAADDRGVDVLQTIPEMPICCNINTHEDQTRDAADTMDIGATKFSEQNPEIKAPIFVQEETKEGFLCESEAGRKPRIQSCEPDSEASDMNLETGHQPTSHPEDDCEYSSEMELEPDMEAENQESEVGSIPSIQSCEPDSEASDMNLETGHQPTSHTEDDFEYSSEKELEPGMEAEKKVGCFDDFFMDEVSFDGESWNSDEYSRSDDTESTGSYDYFESLNNVQVSIPSEVPAAEQEPSREYQNDILFELVLTARIGLPVGDQETCYSIIVEEVTSFDDKKCQSDPNEDATDLLKDPVDETALCVGKVMSGTITDDMASNQNSPDEGGHQIQTELSEEHQTSKTENQDHMDEEECNYEENFNPVDPAREPHSELAALKSIEAESQFDVHVVKAENEAKTETEEIPLARPAVKCKKPIQDLDELGIFNPRAPNFLPLQPEPEAEKIDLRHQELDETRNTEEWMVDYALRQAVTKLGPARKRKVALLVEAFEKVMPMKKCELQTRNGPAFDHARPIQACS